MRFIDTSREYQYFKKEIEEARTKIINSGCFLLGNQTKNLETEFENQITPNMRATAVKNCTDAIVIVLKKIIGNDPNIPVILPNFGAYPTAIAAANITENLHYVDVDDSYTIDVDKLPDLTGGVVIPVHLFGNNCDMKGIKEYAALNNHKILEDCAQSTGSGSGTVGDFSVFSFYPTKPLASMGDGGMICSKLDENDNHFKKYRFYGQDFVSRNIEFIGVNSRIDEFQASIVRSKLERFHELNKKRQIIAKRYKKIVKGMTVRGDCVYHQFPIQFNNRISVLNRMKDSGIPYVIHYGSHVTDHSFLNRNGYKVKNRVSETIVSVPCHPFMTDKEISRVEEVLNEFRSQEKI